MSTAQDVLTASASRSTVELSFGNYLVDLWSRRRMISLILLLAAAAAIAFHFLAPRQYAATIVVSVVNQNESTGSLASAVSRYAGLASLAGISLPGADQKEEALAVLQSDLLTGVYIKDQALLPVLFANLWDAASGRWKDVGAKNVPTLWKATQLFKKQIRTVGNDKSNGFLPSGIVSMTIRWKDPKVASEWANGLVALTNSYLRERAIRESERNIAYLNDQVLKTTVIEARRAIYSVLEQEINKQMLARGRDEFALRVIDPAVPPEKPLGMGLITSVIATCFVVFMLTAAWVLVARYVRYLGSTA